ncbi:MAG: tetratricopeptide repeat protein [Planctomycetota bacterium]
MTSFGDEPGPRGSAERLGEAMDVWLAHRRAPKFDDEELLTRYPHLRDLLEPLLREASGEDAFGAELAPGNAAGGNAVDGGRERPPRIVGDYRLLSEIGRGGAGVVFEAMHVSLGRRVAFKLLGGALVHQPQAVARFRREGELLARLQHPHIVPVYDAGVVDGVPFHAMELVAGPSLHEVLVELRGVDPATCDGATLQRTFVALQPAGASGAGDAVGEQAGHALCARSHCEAAVRLVRRLAEALLEAHRHGVLHRDVKPANVLLRSDGMPLLTDFGLARDRSEPGLTAPGGFLGTAFYVSPEQAAGRHAEVSEASDVFSLGVVLYELLWLKRPFAAGSGEDAAGVAAAPRVMPLPRSRTSGPVPTDLLAVLECALQASPADRYPSMAEFGDELDRVLDLRPVHARRSGPVTRAVRAVRRRPWRTATWAVLVLLAITTAASLAYLKSQAKRIEVARELEQRPLVERHLERAMLAIEHGDAEVAQRAADSAHALAPASPEVVATLAYVQWKRGDVAGATRSLAAIRELAPDLVDQLAAEPASEPVTSLGWFARGLYLLRRGHVQDRPELYEQAAQAMRRAMARAASPRALLHCQYLHALTHLGDAAELQRIADDALFLWPDSAFVAYWRGFALQTAAPGVARAEFERALRLDSSLRDAHLRLAKIDENADRFVSAEERLRRVLQTEPDNRVARRMLARILRRTQRAEQSLRELDRVSSAELPREYRTALERASTLLDLGRLDQAERLVDHAHGLAPDAPRVAVMSAEILRRRGNAGTARRLLEEALQNWPRYIDLHRKLASVCITQRDLGAAEQALLQLLEHAPSDVASWCDVAKLRRMRGNYDAAAAALAEGRRQHPGHWLVHLQTGHLCRVQAQSEAAENAFRLAMQANPNDPESRINTASICFQRGDDEQALSLLADARRVRPGFGYAYRPAIARLEALQRWAEAEAVLHEWCQHRPKDGDKWLQLAALRRRSPEHDSEAAHAALLRAQKLMGDSAGVAFERAEQRLQAGDRDGARGAFAQALAGAGEGSKLGARCRKRLQQLAR